MLSDRRQQVLAALIEEYVQYALPVGSRTLAERYRLGVSPATVRNDLSKLEDQGYISQPHTSAGRIPTDSGYRSFVDNLISDGEIFDEKIDSEAVSKLRSSANELDDLLEETSSALSKFTDCLSIVLSPSVLDVQLKKIDLVSFTDRRALLVVITVDGQVIDRQLEFAQSVASDDLYQIQMLINDAFNGYTVEEIVRRISIGLFPSGPGTTLEYILNEIISCMREAETVHAHRLGMSSLLKQPEFKHASTILPLVELLEDDTLLLELCDVKTPQDGMPVVRIGSENDSKELSGVSVVANRYGRGQAAGIVAVIGPTRMDYSNVLRAVRIVCAALQDE